MTDEPAKKDDAEDCAPGPHRRIMRIDLDERSLARASADIEHERKVAIYDLLEENMFSPEGAPDGPYALRLSIAENRLVFDIRHDDGQEVGKVILSLSPLRKVIKDYFILCESYYDAIRNAAPAQIETIDMARRALHNEGAELLQARLDGKITLDFQTGRRLFTLICILHLR